ncbi:hypothetical protein V8E36_001363 [Tilletia maclaganii]
MVSASFPAIWLPVGSPQRCDRNASSATLWSPSMGEESVKTKLPVADLRAYWNSVSFLFPDGDSFQCEYGLPFVPTCPLC